jgi:hypothetical protein
MVVETTEVVRWASDCRAPLDLVWWKAATESVESWAGVWSKLAATWNVRGIDVYVAEDHEVEVDAVNGVRVVMLLRVPIIIGELE